MTESRWNSFFRFLFNGKLSLFFPLPTSSFIDFSDKVPGTRSHFDFNKKNQNLHIIAGSRGFSSEILAVPEQIHSTEITRIDSPGNYMAVDGLITDNPAIILTLQVADCVPVYLSSSHIIGLVHSGWRGTAGDIVSNSIRKMLEMGANRKEVSIFLGPAVGICCYEVNREVANNFNKNAKKRLENGKWKIGLHEEICLQLTKIGIPSFNIQTSDLCTYESPNCHSFRRDGTLAGRMFAFMRLKP